MTSKDTITVEADSNGSILTYAELKPKVLFDLSDPLLGLTFRISFRGGPHQPTPEAIGATGQ